jgi:hypothetical protein
MLVSFQPDSDPASHHWKHTHHPNPRRHPVHLTHLASMALAAPAPDPGVPAPAAPSFVDQTAIYGLLTFLMFVVAGWVCFLIIVGARRQGRVGDAAKQGVIVLLGFTLFGLVVGGTLIGFGNSIVDFFAN